MASTSPMATSASASTWRIRPGRISTWARAAISGTTPPNGRCASFWPTIAWARIWRSLVTSAAALSSQEDSRPRMSAIRQALCLKGRRSASAARMDGFLKLGTRGSPLALAQAHMVATSLEAAHHWLGRRVAIVPVTTSGDQITDRPLAEIGGKALWTKELDLALLDGQTDVSVHSMKDVESERPASLASAPCCPRADVRDRLIGAGSIDALAQGRARRHLFAAPRGAAAARPARPRHRADPRQCRNAPRQGRSRRGRRDPARRRRPRPARAAEAGMAVPVDVMLPAPGQGAIGIECRADDGTRHAKLSRDRPCDRPLPRCGPSAPSPGRSAAPATRRSERWRIAMRASSGCAPKSSARTAASRSPTRRASPSATKRRRQSSPGAMLDRAPASIRRLFAGQ